MKQTVGQGSGQIIALTLALIAGITTGVAADRDEERLLGVVTAVGGATLPTSITLSTASGEETLTLTHETEFELDDDDREDDELDALHEGEEDEDDEDGDGRDDEEEAEEDAFAGDPTQLLGLFVKAEFNPEDRTVEEIEIETEFETFGRVRAVDPVAATVTIEPFGGAPVTLTVTDETEVEVDGAEAAGLSDLAGRFVEAEYDPNTLVAEKIEADDDDLAQGTIESVDPATGVLVVRVDGTSVSFAVTEDTDVDLDFQDAELSSLLPGHQVLIEFEEEDGLLFAERVNAITPRAVPVSGTVATVSATSQTLVLAPRRRSSGRNRAQALPLLKVNAGTTVRVNGKRAALAAVPAGSKVRVRVVPSDGVYVVRSLIARVPRRR